MRRVFIFYLMLLCLMKGEGLWGQCATKPRVVRIQAQSCGTTEKQNEFYQFITRDSSYDLVNNVTSISSGGNPITNSFGPPTIAFLNALNAKIKSCSSLPLFLDPYSSPYNGVVPPNSVVLAFIDQNPIADAIRVNLDTLCGKSKIFIIKGVGSNSSPMFINKASCAVNCLRDININFGSCSYTLKYDGNQLQDVAGAYVLVNPDNSLVYLANDGCTPYNLPCVKPKFIAPNLSPLTCGSVGYQLPIMSDINTGNAKYYTKPGRKGTAYSEGTILYDSITLYANDFTRCDSSGTTIEKTYFVNLKPGPNIDISLARTDTACGYFVLPKIILTNPSGNQKYWSDSLGTLLPSFKEGDTIKSSVTLYAYDNNFGCPDSRKFSIKFLSAPEIKNIPDTLVPCGKAFLLPVITGSNLNSAGYYTASNKGGMAPAFGSPILSKTTLYLYDQFSHCIDEDTLTISLAPTIILPKDTF
ncbi:MAG: hypothetical protein ABI761_19335, partial [Saprospiraceae bacterium]